MALAKTVAYTPFNKTSFGYGSGEIAAAHSSLTNVKVVIQADLNTQWDTTGHISTTSSGSASTSYSKSGSPTGESGPKWTCEGTVADVDAVLDNLDFFPADYPAIRNWTTTALKTNVTAGTYTNEEPFNTNAIPDTVFSLKVYDGDSPYSLISTNTVTFDPTQPTFGKQRPYWSTEPTDEDLVGVGVSNVSGVVVNAGVIAQGSDTDPLTVTCEFRNYGTTTRNDSGAYGQFASSDDLFVGDKKPAATNSTDKRLNFTGTKAEVQSYLNGVKFWQPSANFTTFDMFFTLSNGVVGSTVTKSCWDSGSIIGVATVPNQSFVEDQSTVTAALWSFGDLDITNVQPDVDSFSAIITITTAAGIAGTDTIASTNLGGGSSTYVSGVLTVTCDTKAKLKTALQSVLYTPNQDYNTNFTMSFQLSFTGSALSSTYTSTTQTGIVVTGASTEEVSNKVTAHPYTEDHVYNFSNGTVPEIIHPVNENFTVTFTMNSQAGRLWAPGTSTWTYAGGHGFTDNGNGVYTLSGTRDNVNADWRTLYYSPTTDYFANHTIDFTVVRTSGSGSPPTTSGSFTMTGTDVGEITSTQLINVVWEEDTNLTFDTGLEITDTADEVVDNLVFGSHYTASCEMHVSTGGVQFTDGILKVDDTGRTLTTTTSGAFVVGYQYTILTINDGLTPVGADTDFTLIGAADNNIGTIFIATGVGLGTGTATGDLLTITGTGQGYDELAISGPKTAVNTAIKNIQFIPDADYDGAGPYVWYYITRNYDSISLTNVDSQGNSYDPNLVTKFLSASSTEDYLPTNVVLSWEENVTKVFDSGLVINDKVTENPEYNTSPTAFYGTTYTVDVVMFAGYGDIKYTNATLDTATKGSLVITGTGQSEADKFQMTGSRADLIAALKTMKFIPNADIVETVNDTLLSYRIKRDYDYNWTTDSQDGSGEVGLLHNQGKDGAGNWVDDVKTVFNTNTATTNFTSTPTQSHADWNEDEVLDFDSGLVITDKATENPDYGHLFDTTFTATARAKYFKNIPATAIAVGGYTVITTLGDTDWNVVAGTTGETYSVGTGINNAAAVGTGTGIAHQSNPMTNAIWTTTTSGLPSLSVSGVGTDADPLTITGTKAEVNTALANIRMAGEIDWTYPVDGFNGQFWLEFKLVRDADGITYMNFGVSSNSFNPGTAMDPYLATVSPAMTYNEDTVTKIFAGKTLGISETASDYRTNIKYQVAVEIYPNADGTWGETGNSTYTSPKTTRVAVNDALLALDFKPTIDSHADPVIKYTQTRYQNFTAGSFVVGTAYSIVSYGTTTNDQWNTIAGTTGVTYGQGTTFTAATVGVGTGTADIVTVQATAVTIGTVTGTPVSPYVTSVTGMAFDENVNTSIFSGKTIGITEDVSAYTSVETYTVELEISPSSHGNWKGTTGNHIKTITGTKAFVNAEIQVATVEPLADGPNLTAGSFIVGNKYTITAVGTTDFVNEQGASANTIGIVFTATAVGTGTGTADESIDFDILYSQTRHISGVNVNQTPTPVNLGTAVGTDSPEFRYGTTNQNIQYFVTDDDFNGVDTTASYYEISHGLADVRLTPKQLFYNKHRSQVYERPITITDTTSDAQYKIIFSGGTLLNSPASLSTLDTGWQTKDDLHNIMEDVYVITNGITPYHGQPYTSNFTIHKKAYTGEVNQMAQGQLQYQFQTGMTLWSSPTFTYERRYYWSQHYGWVGYDQSIPKTLAQRTSVGADGYFSTSGGVYNEVKTTDGKRYKGIVDWTEPLNIPTLDISAGPNMQRVSKFGNYQIFARYQGRYLTQQDLSWRNSSGSAYGKVNSINGGGIIIQTTIPRSFWNFWGVRIKVQYD